MDVVCKLLNLSVVGVNGELLSILNKRCVPPKIVNLPYFWQVRNEPNEQTQYFLNTM